MVFSSCSRRRPSVRIAPFPLPCLAGAGLAIGSAGRVPVCHLDTACHVSEEEQVRYLRILAWILVIGLVVATVVPASDRPETGLEHHYEHLVAFSLVGLVFALAYSQRPMVLITSGIVFALLLELAQIPLPSRHARITDFLIDALGASVGITMAFLARSVRKSPVA